MEEENQAVENKWKENETVISKITQELNQTKQDSEKEKVIYHKIPYPTHNDKKLCVQCSQINSRTFSSMYIYLIWSLH